MNKRARLARRIIRDHRHGIGFFFHLEKTKSGAWRIWGCPHCRPYIRPTKPARTYR